MKPKRCEGWRRHGGAFTLGPVKWEQCQSDAIAVLTVKQEGETQTLPACNTCWQEAIENKIEIISIHMLKPKPLPAKSKAAIGAHVQFCGHAGWFIADVFHFDGVVGVKANGPVTPDNIVRNRMDEATHHISDFPKAGLWCPDRGVFCVPENQFNIIKRNGKKTKKV